MLPYTALYLWRNIAYISTIARHFSENSQLKGQLKTKFFE